MTTTDSAGDTQMLDVDHSTQLDNNATSFLSDADLEEKFPNRPRNHGPTWPFHSLFQRLFDPLLDNRRRPGVGAAAVPRAKLGPHGPHKRSPQEQRDMIVERFFTQWRNEVGPDIYPALRLIVPDRDRDRAMYGLKEKTIGKLLVRVMGINKNSEDAISLLNWKLPGQSAASRMAGDFAGRCFEIIKKRPVLVDAGRMTIQDVNDLLDELSRAAREEDQVKIFNRFYSAMNPTELLWLIRIILRQMKIGATERTFFKLWHPDAEDLFSVSSSLRRVCWDLADPTARLEPDDRGIALMQCFQPQLAQFRMNSFDKMVAKLGPTEDDPEFWIEEKLDGERMQLHMKSDPGVPGGRRFAFWSRKAKDYTYLYGNGLHDDNSALTRHLAAAFDKRVDNIILDGEMVTWDPEIKAIVAFGTLKTAAIEMQRNPSNLSHPRPLYKVFDILYLNDKALTGYTLRDRRRALDATVKSVSERLEVLSYKVATNADEIDPLLRKVIENKSEGLVLKNPRSAYRLNERNDDWMKVKPEYMDEFGESLDCIVVGGYFGSGHRGGNLSSFLCGLIVKRKNLKPSDNPQKCWSFFKVGGGFTAQDYANIRHQTDGKWIDWDRERPPLDWVELGGGKLQYERPDVWIKPEDSVVLEVKAASVNDTESFRTPKTLRFPRFKKLRADRDWTTALSVDEFLELHSRVTDEVKDKKFKVDDERRKRLKRADTRREVRIAGRMLDDVEVPYTGPDSKVFEGLTFFIMSDCIGPEKKTKVELEQLVKANGGTIRQSHDAAPDTLCVADRRLVKVAALQKRGDINIVRPKWLLDCIGQAQVDIGRPRLLLPYEPNHMLHATEDFAPSLQESVDEYGDSFARDVTVDELGQIFNTMVTVQDGSGQRARAASLRSQLEDHGHGLGIGRGGILEGTHLYLDYAQGAAFDGEDPNGKTLALRKAGFTARFAGAVTVDHLGGGNAGDQVTHIILHPSDRERATELRRLVAEKSRMPRIVSLDWVQRSWIEGTRLDEEQFAIA